MLSRFAFRRVLNQPLRLALSTNAPGASLLPHSYGCVRTSSSHISSSVAASKHKKNIKELLTTDNIFGAAAISGFTIGGLTSTYYTYNDTLHLSYNDAVMTSTVYFIVGGLYGISFIILSPLIVPIASIFAIHRYFNATPHSNEDDERYQLRQIINQFWYEYERHKREEIKNKNGTLLTNKETENEQKNGAPQN